ncbi:uncharacterized protein LOC141752913 isoform X2 [Sebastes fasciatus]|uniref:uncharacterized protein LOC141752913 isoform X2 n=1 Tax=Sebastes fasciatus TaxID=394691 RepID=UPI003D9E326F
MSLGSSNMAGGALGTAFSLLLLASIIQGLRDDEVFHNEKMEAVEGQNVTLTCTVKNSTDLKIASIEWSKNKKTKLALFDRIYGIHLFWPNVTMQIENTNRFGSHLHLYGVTKQDSGVYGCDFATFPLGSIRRETELEIKDDVKIMCDADGVVEVHTGENVTIRCRAFPDATYKWAKNKTLVSENESLALWCVTDAHTGVYTLTVNTGNKSLHKEFVVTVLTATTSLRTDLVTVPAQSNVTEAGLIEPADSDLTTSPTWTTNMDTDVTHDNPNARNVTAGEHMASLTDSTHISFTSPPGTHKEPDHFNHSTDQEINPTPNVNTSSNLSTTLSYGNKVFRSTPETRNESTRGNPVATLSTGSTTIVTEDEGGERSHLLLIIVPIVVLIALAGFLYMRQTMKERMDQPPPFKPPPPPVKYTAVTHREISTQQFPTSRCNSVMELKDTKQIIINM